MAVDEQSFAESGGWTSPNTAASRRKLWEAMLSQGIDSSPIRHWTQGASRLAQALIGGYGGYKADEDEREGWRNIGDILGGSLPHPSTPSVGKPGTDTPAAPTPPTASLSAPATGTSEPGTYPGVRPGTAFTDRWRAFLDDLRNAGVTVDPTQSGGFANRNIRGTNTPSLHASDQAYDVNWRANPEGQAPDQADIARQMLERDMDPNAPPVTQVHPFLARDLADRHGLRWGGDFTGRSPDPMHFEVASGVPMAQRSITARAGLPGTPQVRGWMGGPPGQPAGNPANDALVPPQQPLSAADLASGDAFAGDWSVAAPPGDAFAGDWSPANPQPPDYSALGGIGPMTPEAAVNARRLLGGARGFANRHLPVPPGGPMPTGPTPAPAPATPQPAPGAPPPATSVNQPLATPTDVPGVSVGSPSQPAPPGMPQPPAAAPAPAALPPAAAQAQTMSGTDVIRRLLQSRNPQAIQFGLQLYRDMARRGGTADYDFQAVEGTLYRVNKRTGQAEVVAGTGQGRPPEAIRTQAIKADQAYQSLTTLLDNYERLVSRTGMTVMPGPDRDAVTQARTQILLQLKELNNLGVLNGPDLELMNNMLTDTGISAGNIWSNPADRVSSSVSRLKEMLRTIRNNQTSAVGMPPVQGGQQGSGGANDPLGIR